MDDYAARLRSHYVALKDGWHSGSTAKDLLTQREDFLHRVFYKMLRPGEYMATNHDIIITKSWEATHVGSYRTQTSIVKHSNNSDYNVWTRDPIQGIKLSPIPVLTALRSSTGKLLPWTADILVTSWPCVFIDIDHKDLLSNGHTEESIWSLMEAMGIPKPTVWVKSGSGYGRHGWWVFDEPLSATSDTTVSPHLRKLQDARFLVQQLSSHLCGDIAQTRTKPSLRLPGSINPKFDKADGVFRLCEIDYNKSTMCSMSVESFQGMPICERVWRKKPMQQRLGGLPDWVGVLLTALDAALAPGRAKDGCRPLVRCPGCNRSGTGYIVSNGDASALNCHRTSCMYGGSYTNLSTLAHEYGISTASVDVIETIDEVYPQVPITKIPFADHGLGPEISLTKTAVERWGQGVGVVGDKRQLTICATATGALKTTTTMQYLDNHGLGDTVFFCQNSKDISRISEEFHNPQVHGGKAPLRVLLSPQVAEVDGVGCAHPHRGEVYAKRGYAFSRGCDECPAYNTCPVRGGVFRKDPYQMSGKMRAITLATTTRLERTDIGQTLDACVIDEHVSPVVSYEVTLDELRSWAMALADHYGKDGQDYKDTSQALLTVYHRLSNIASNKAQIHPDWSLLTSDVSWGSVPNAWADETFSWPSWISRVVSAIKEPSPYMYMSLFNGSLRLDVAAVEYWPQSVLLLDATARIYTDIYNKLANTTDVHWYGNKLLSHTRETYLPSPGSRKAYHKAGSQEPVASAIRRLRVILMHRREEWDLSYNDDGNAVYRVLVITYKSWAESCIVRAMLDNLPGMEVQITYSHKAAGTNEFAGMLDLLLFFGPTNLNTSGLDVAIERIFGQQSTWLMHMDNERIYQQGKGRPRDQYVVKARDAASDTHMTEVMYATPYAPHCMAIETSNVEHLESSLGGSILSDKALWGQVLHRLIIEDKRCLNVIKAIVTRRFSHMCDVVRNGNIGELAWCPKTPASMTSMSHTHDKNCQWVQPYPSEVVAHTVNYIGRSDQLTQNNASDVSVIAHTLDILRRMSELIPLRPTTFKSVLKEHTRRSESNAGPAKVEECYAVWRWLGMVLDALPREHMLESDRCRILADAKSHGLAEAIHRHFTY